MNICVIGDQTAFVLMKLSYFQAESPDRKNNRPGFLRCYWWCGIVLVTITGTLYNVMTAWVPLTLASSTEAASVLAAVCLSIFWLKERFYIYFDIPGILIVIAGSIGLILTASKD